MSEADPQKAPHKRFTSLGTAYMRNQTREALNGRWIAVHYQEPPRLTERGTSHSMRFPFLILADYVANPEEVAEKVARILEAHWDDDSACRPADWTVERDHDEDTPYGKAFRVMLPSGEWYCVIAVDEADALSDARLNNP